MMQVKIYKNKNGDDAGKARMILDRQYGTLNRAAVCVSID